ncbi:MAG: ABC transporter permease [Acidimicrobiia bacterium]|nr:ABC transporter permease [Acidimicrobiia bacterium]
MTSNRLLYALIPAGVVVVAAFGLLLAAGTNGFEPIKLIVEGSIGWPPFEEGTSSKVGDTVMVWVPIALASAGLIVTFNAGMWNIGIEGQIIMGAIFAAFVAREVSVSRPLLIALIILAGAVGGMLWGLLVGVLRTAGGVNEIFGGLGLDFVAASITTYLIIDPWSRTGVASTSGTDPFPDEALLPSLEGTRLSPLAIVITLVAIAGIWLLFRGTLYGLKLKAVGRNRPSSFLMGIPTNRYLLGAFVICGALAGIAGTSQAIGFHFRLIPAISGNYGFLAILVVLLARFRAFWVIPISFFFAMIAVGSSQLQLRLDVNSALGGVLQGTLVLSAMFGLGWAAHRFRKQAEAGAEST